MANRNTRISVDEWLFSSRMAKDDYANAKPIVSTVRWGLIKVDIRQGFSRTGDQMMKGGGGKMHTKSNVIA
jgi:hypothetical protein